MSLSIAAVVGGSLLVVAVAGGVAGVSEHSHQRKRKWAAGVWRDVSLRNGVTEPSPFHSTQSSFNAPGLVQVYPRSQVRPVSPLPPSASPKPVSTAVIPVDELAEELPCDPLELSDPPHPAERARCRRLYQQGMSQTKVISELWGLSKGGSKKYYEARRRFRIHVADIATGDLKASIEAEGVTANA